MKDTIHGKKKNWPHFDKIHLSSQAYSEGYDRIFNKTKKTKVKKVVRKKNGVQ